MGMRHPSEKGGTVWDQTLLDSSPSRAPVLTSRQRGIALLSGLAGFAVCQIGLSVLVGAPKARALLAPSLLIGAAIALTALMLCYVSADARRLGLNAWAWCPLVVALNLAGFLAYLAYSAAKTGNWKRATIPVAYLFEAALVGGLVLMPLINTEALSKIQLVSRQLDLPSPPPPPPTAAPSLVRKSRRVTAEDILTAPPIIPKTILQIQEAPEHPGSASLVAPEGIPGGVPGGTQEAVLGNILGPFIAPPPLQPRASKATPIRVGGQVQAARLILQVKPEYPPLAKLARVQGTVRLEAVIASDGTIKDLKVVQGHPLLVKAALEAVSRWRYQPTLLNGEPVEVLTEIDVNFTLSD